MLKSRILVYITLIALCTGCSMLTKNFVLPTATPMPISLQAIYLVEAQGQITSEDLQAHPEVFVTDSFDVLMRYSTNKVALWIDKNAVHLVNNLWLNEPPQKYYPIVLVGYNNWLYSFRDQLNIFMIQGPYVDWSKMTLEPGFSVGMLTKESANETAAFAKEYSEMPTATRILEITNELLPKSLAR
jgi:hypothetical protein